MRFTTQADYGLICALYLARFGGERTVAAREMAKAENLPSELNRLVELEMEGSVG